MANKTFECSIDGEVQGTFSLTREIDRSDFPELYELLNLAEVGEVVLAGGGSAPVFEYKRIS